MLFGYGRVVLWRGGTVQMVLIREFKWHYILIREYDIVFSK